METVIKINGGLERIGGYLTKTPRRSFLSGLVIYTLFIAVLSFPTVISEFMRTGSLLGYDSEAQYFPFLINFRENLAAFFNGVVNGRPVLPMMNFGYEYGADMFTANVALFMPFIPYYAFSVLVPVDGIACFYSIGTLILSYLSGISFLCMCRHYDGNMLLSGLFAPLYVLCGGYMFTGLYNQHFLYMYIAFPLFIVGIDRIIHGRSAVLFILTVFWLSLSGFTLIVYTMPFVVLFAMIRVYFVHPDTYFRSLAKYFLRGVGAFAVGTLMSSMIYLPMVYEFLASSRINSGVHADISKLLVPDMEYLSNMLIPSEMQLDTGICAACIPCFIFVLVSLGKNTELKIYGLVSMLLVSLPLIRYGLNGFQYPLCRWGFIPAMLMAFISVKAFPDFIRQDKNQLILTSAVTACYLLAVCAEQNTLALLAVTVSSLITAVPPLRRVCGRACGLASGFRDKKYAHLLKTAIVIAALLLLAMYLVYVIVFVKSIIPSLLVSVPVSVAAAIIAYRSGKLHTLCGSVLVIFLAVSCVISYYGSGLTGYVDDMICTVDEFYGAAPTKKFLETADPSGTFGRVAFIGAESNSYGEYGETKPAENLTDNADSGGADAEKDDYASMNAALRYGYPDTCIFKSIIDSDMLNFMLRCGQDANSLLSRVNTSEFGGKDVLYSLFGVRYMYSFDESRFFYGRELDEKVSLGEDSALYYYINKYALPIGVTYSLTSDAERFGSFDAAELPFAMMNEVYLEGSGLSADVHEGDAHYARRCSIAHEKTSRGTTSYGIECHDNRMTISDDVSGCFLFISFDGVNVVKSPGQDNEYLTVSVDKERNCYFSLHNRKYDWPWSISSDHYTLSLGYFENGVHELEFVSAFEYSDAYVTAVPAADYVRAYSELTRETLQNVQISDNALSGDITVSQDKVLSINLLHKDGWRAYVDGRETPVYKANGLFLGIPLEKGSHTVEIRYLTPCLIEGAVISAVSIAAFIAAVLIHKKKSKNKA